MSVDFILLQRAIKYINNPFHQTPAYILNNILKSAFLKVSVQWDIYDEQYVYGHALYTLTSANSPYDLPIYLKLAQCQRHDSILSISTLTSAYKTYQDTFSFSIFVGDKAHDNYPFYYFLNPST